MEDQNNLRFGIFFFGGMVFFKLLEGPSEWDNLHSNVLGKSACFNDECFYKSYIIQQNEQKNQNRFLSEILNWVRN